MNLRIMHTAMVAAFALSSCTLLLPGESIEPGKAILVGISEYQNPGVNDLLVADDDAIDLADALGTRGWETTLLLNHEATRSNILSTIAEAGAATGKDRRLLVYFSGHGDSDRLIATNYDPSDPTVGSVTSTDLATALADLQSTRVVLIIDACYSGSFVNTGRSVDPTPPNSGLYDDGLERTLFGFTSTELAEMYSRAIRAGQDYRGPLVISAAGAGELSWESGPNGIFTSFLLEAAEKADRDGDRAVSVLEAFAYAKAGVELTWNSWNRRYFDEYSETYADYLPRASGGTQDILLFN